MNSTEPASYAGFAEKVRTRLLSLRHTARKVIYFQLFVTVAVRQPISGPILPINDQRQLFVAPWAPSISIGETPAPH